MTELINTIDAMHPLLKITLLIIAFSVLWVAGIKFQFFLWRNNTEKEGRLLQKRQTESREKMIFRHNLERAKLQKPIVELRDQHRLERVQLARAIHLAKMRDEARSKLIENSKNDRKTSKLSRVFGRASTGKMVSRGESDGGGGAKYNRHNPNSNAHRYRKLDR